MSLTQPTRELIISGLAIVDHIRRQTVSFDEDVKRNLAHHPGTEVRRAVATTQLTQRPRYVNSVAPDGSHTVKLTMGARWLQWLRDHDTDAFLALLSTNGRRAELFDAGPNLWEVLDLLAGATYVDDALQAGTDLVTQLHETISVLDPTCTRGDVKKAAFRHIFSSDNPPAPGWFAQAFAQAYPTWEEFIATPHSAWILPEMRNRIALANIGARFMSDKTTNAVMLLDNSEVVYLQD